METTPAWRMPRIFFATMEPCIVYNCHKAAAEAVVALPKMTGDFGELLSIAHAKEKGSDMARSGNEGVHENNKGRTN